MKRLERNGYLTDKPDSILRNYETLFEPLLERPVALLELGVDRGGSLQMWRDYFPAGVIAGLDFNPVTIDDPSGRIKTYEGLQEDTALLDRIAAEVAPGGFDIIIDDAAHCGEMARASFWHLFTRYLKPGGIYSIEHWGVGYWNRRDGYEYVGDLHKIEVPSTHVNKTTIRRRFPSHDFGMVGFIKELIDEQGMRSITEPSLGVSPARDTRFERMMIDPLQVAVVKKK
jgi:hypothetical protein